MNILEQFLKAVEYKITDAWQHQWKSYNDAQVLGCENEFASMSIMYDRRDQTVIEISVSTELEARAQHAYRWLNPDYRDAIMAEADSRGVNKMQAFDGLDYIDLDVVEDILEKGKALLANEVFDTRVQIPLEFSEEELMRYFRMAHERDITLNQLISEALMRVITDSQPKNS
jgi:hypothetical protein